MNSEDWHDWCVKVSESVSNIEKTIKLQKRLLILISLGMTITNGLLIIHLL